MSNGWDYMEKILDKLADIADELDDTEWFSFADEVTDVMKRLKEKTISTDFRQGKK